jgi:predicted transcriptional regulator
VTVRSFENASQVLGDLETRVMNILWADNPLAVRDVKARLKGTKLAYTTVMTTLDRLYRKGLLARTKNGLAFVYLPAMDRDEYHRRVVHAALAPLLAQGAGPVMAAFVDAAAGADDDNLAELERLIAARRKRPQGG